MNNRFEPAGIRQSYTGLVSITSIPSPMTDTDLLYSEFDMSVMNDQFLQTAIESSNDFRTINAIQMMAPCQCMHDLFQTVHHEQPHTRTARAEAPTRPCTKGF